MQTFATTVQNIIGQATKTAVGLTWESFLATVLYALLGVGMMIGFMVFANIFFKLDLRNELVKDNNTGLGVAIAGIAIAIAIIISGTISG